MKDDIIVYLLAGSADDASQTVDEVLIVPNAANAAYVHGGRGGARSGLRGHGRS